MLRLRENRDTQEVEQIMEISVGQPPEDGRYVIFTGCAALTARGWCEPHIATWHGGKWHYGEPVYGWIGPLPVVRARELLEKPRTEPAQEYDL